MSTPDKTPKQLNRVELAGTLSMVKSGTTKTGGKWAMAMLAQDAGGKWPDKFSVKTFHADDVDLFRDGAAVKVVGRLRNESWTDQSGAKRYGVAIMCETVERDGPPAAGKPATPARREERRPEPAASPPYDADDEVPF